MRLDDTCTRAKCRSAAAADGDADLDRVLLPLDLRTVDVQVYGLPYPHRLALLTLGNLEPRVVVVG